MNARTSYSSPVFTTVINNPFQGIHYLSSNSAPGNRAKAYVHNMPNGELILFHSICITRWLNPCRLGRCRRYVLSTILLDVIQVIS